MIKVISEKFFNAIKDEFKFYYFFYFSVDILSQRLKQDIFSKFLSGEIEYYSQRGDQPYRAL